MQYDSEEHILRHVVCFIVQIAVVIAFAWFLVHSFGTQTMNQGQSMRPVLEDGDRLLIDRMTLKLCGPERFDLVLFEKEDGTPNIKRIIGLPGETVQIRDGSIYLNGSKAEFPEGVPDMPASIAGLAENPVTLGEDEYFVLGDNRDVSEDSRSENTGNVKFSEMEGKIWFRIAPFEKIGFLKRGKT